MTNLDLTLEAWHSLDDPRPELWLFGIEPELAQDEGIRYFTRPSDAEVNELLSRSSVFLQTSRHEGFCLPLLEAMAAGTPVVCTDATATATSAETASTAFWSSRIRALSQLR